MSIFIKILILFVLFVALNIVSIYTFSYEDYFSDRKKEITLDENSGILKSIKEKIFKKVEYIPSDFFINKENNLILLNGTFPNQNTVNQIVELLKINKTNDIKIVENSKVDKQLLVEISGLIELLKDFFENDSKIIFINNTLTFDGVLKDIKYKDLVFDKISKITSVTIFNNIKEPILVEELEKDINIDNNHINKSNILTKDEIQLLINNSIIENKIIFERRSVEITPKSKDTIQKIADILNQYTVYKVEIAGHTDSRGNKELNKQISQDRANSVKSLLESFGVESSRITAIGYGNERPIAKDDENGLSEINRRVEFNIGE
ncbi:OmpA family protein [Aliarcobacter vitoriensis]|uniref:OmpA-like domain-containing protein n=1 Tax=Aliarcobacter vitoriensis TaxID=2011099 RepID=A0A366MR58_9BACT|nr:OmpA family protein [Aliarcobacter vitoriensis]RBQ28771.1 hypothetical protein CRU91_07180 [Aliarcobacter vitoriensis]